MFRTTAIALTTALLSAQAPTSRGGPANPSQVANDQVLARLGNHLIKESDFRSFLDKAGTPQQRKQMEASSESLANARKQFLTFTILEAKARKDGFDKTPEYKNQRAVVEAQLLIQALMKRDSPGIQNQTPVKDEDLKAYFDTHQDQFKTPESFNARHILVSVKGSPSASPTALSEDEARAKALQAIKALAEGKGWEAVAKEFSDDPGSKEKGGLYENVTYGSFVPEFEQAIRSQEPGKVGEPVKSKFGFHVIQVEKRNPETVPAFETIKEQIRPKALAARQEGAFLAYVEGLKKDVGFLEGEQMMQAPKGKALQPVRTQTRKLSAQK